MGKFYAGMLVGFFLATALMFGIIQIYVAPYTEAIKTTQPYAQEVYAITHSGYYSNAQNVAAKVSEVASQLAALPLIGAGMQSTHVEQYAKTAVTLFENAKQSSEMTVTLVGWAIMVLGITLPALLFSILMVIVGVWMYKSDCCPCCAEEKAPSAKKGKKR